MLDRTRWCVSNPTITYRPLTAFKTKVTKVISFEYKIKHKKIAFSKGATNEEEKDK